VATRYQTRKRMRAHAMHTCFEVYACRPQPEACACPHKTAHTCTHLHVGPVEDEERGCVGADARLEAHQ
jgi:hypothetical protein